MILTAKCCGKTSLKKEGYVDLDIFSRHPTHFPIAKEILRAFIQANKDDQRVYLMNIGAFKSFGLEDLEGIEIVKVYLPVLTPEEIAFRRNLLRQRDLRIFGFFRVPELLKLPDTYIRSYEYCKEHSLEVTQLGPKQFLQDVL